MTLYLIGIGLNDEKDISLKGIEAIKKCDKLYLENYTSKLNTDIKNLEDLYGKKIILADRNLIENNYKIILEEAKSGNIAVLIIGDVFSATTHLTIYLEAKKLKINIIVINNASIISAIGITGLSLYRFGQVTTIPFDNKDIDSPIKVIKDNLKNNLHTLVLLDIKDGKCMDFKDAINYLLDKNLENINCIMVAALSSEQPIIKIGKLKDLLKINIDKYPQSLIIPTKLQFYEEEALNIYK